MIARSSIGCSISGKAPPSAATLIVARLSLGRSEIAYAVGSLLAARTGIMSETCFQHGPPPQHLEFKKGEGSGDTSPERVREVARSRSEIIIDLSIIIPS